MDRVHHELQHRVDNCARLLRVKLAHQFGRPFDISEQRRNRLPFAIDGVCGSGLPGCEANLAHICRRTYRLHRTPLWDSIKSGTAFAAESFFRLVGSAAPRAGNSQRAP